MNVGPQFADPVARQLYAEIASIEEQHVTQYESIGDASESWLEKWLLHEANEAYNYYACVESERDPRVKRIWERFLDYELGHVRYVADLFENIERRDAAEVLPRRMPETIRYESHREFVRDVLREEVELSARGPEFVHRSDESRATREYRKHLNSEGSPSDEVSAGYVWRPGTELVTPGREAVYQPRARERSHPIGRSDR
jgi:rubrerythrin